MRPTLDLDIEIRSVHMVLEDAILEGDLSLPTGATGLVLFAHGSGTGRVSPRNRMLARKLQEAGIGTLLFDLFTPRESTADALDGHLRFNIGFLADRLSATADWVSHNEELSGLDLGYFGTGTGAAAALVAAARRPRLVSAIVSRGGRPDLAGSALRHVTAPTLLIVGARDSEVIRLNELAVGRLAAPEKELIIVPRATHLFDEQGTLEQVAHLASDWFQSRFPETRN